MLARTAPAPRKVAARAAQVPVLAQHKLAAAKPEAQLARVITVSIISLEVLAMAAQVRKPQPSVRLSSMAH